jgi:hypothetical protein
MQEDTFDGIDYRKNFRFSPTQVKKTLKWNLIRRFRKLDRALF